VEGLEIARRLRPRGARPWTAARRPDRVGPVEVRRAKARDRADVAADEKIRLTSSILPKRARRTKSLDALPVLYLRGVLTGDFQEALAALQPLTFAFRGQRSIDRRSMHRDPNSAHGLPRLRSEIIAGQSWRDQVIDFTGAPGTIRTSDPRRFVWGSADNRERCRQALEFHRGPLWGYW
jgi:hypothetical protein